MGEPTITQVYDALMSHPVTFKDAIMTYHEYRSNKNERNLRITRMYYSIIEGAFYGVNRPFEGLDFEELGNRLDQNR